MDEQQLLRLKPELDKFLDRFAPLFGREENHKHARQFVQGLLRKGQRRNIENIAETVSGGVVRTLQAFISSGVWSDRDILKELMQLVRESLADPDAVWNTDETGVPKKGENSVGVKRQYSGTLGRTDNCQIGVFANYASVHGHTFIDRRLYLPKEWADDQARCQAAGVPKNVIFRTKPELALEMLSEALEAGLPFRWVGGDSVYGDNPTFVQGIRLLGKWYVLDIASDTQVWTEPPQVIVPESHSPHGQVGKSTKAKVVGTRQRVDAAVAALPASAWRRVVVGEGSKGPRVYDYAEIPVWFCEDGLPGPPERLLVRRSIGQEPDLKYHRSNAPGEIGLEKLAQVRGCRWTIEEDIKSGKGECGLDEYETRGWVGWHHHTVLSILALAFLVLQQRRLVAEATEVGVGEASVPQVEASTPQVVASRKKKTSRIPAPVRPRRRRLVSPHLVE